MKQMTKLEIFFTNGTVQDMTFDFDSDEKTAELKEHIKKASGFIDFDFEHNRELVKINLRNVNYIRVSEFAEGVEEPEIVPDKKTHK